MATLSLEQIKVLLSDEKIRAIISNDTDIDQQHLKNVDILNSSEFEKIQVNAQYWIHHYGELVETYSSQYDYEINPIQITAIGSLYLVEIIDDEAKFFDSMDQATKYAEENIARFFNE
jgi:hypothetical protein